MTETSQFGVRARSAACVYCSSWIKVGYGQIHSWEVITIHAVGMILDFHVLPNHQILCTTLHWLLHSTLHIAHLLYHSSSHHLSQHTPGWLSSVGQHLHLRWFCSTNDNICIYSHQAKTQHNTKTTQRLTMASCEKWTIFVFVKVTQYNQQSTLSTQYHNSLYKVEPSWQTSHITEHIQHYITK